ncbi:ATP-binding cassette domain-containing protein [Corynebacterium cystitidis]|uniref:ATP-binding cassette domain-containing protein n=1 Tax=Corynebacterium cystitidis TaxID=35757 RepID=UPI00211DF3CC|nr:ATP-binding cassette domain-containing protein [Corynebacterium cystitidis]
MISIKNLSVHYLNGDEQLPPALEGVTLDVAKGEVVLLTGASGCGKSTLLRSINGLIPHFHEAAIAGQVTVNGIDVAGSSISELARHVEMVFQDPRSEFFTLDVTSELAFCCENFQIPAEDISQRISEVSRAVGIEDLAGRNIMRLSSGEKQKVALAAAMTTRPEILLFDEPSANLDSESLVMLSAVISRLKDSGVTVIIADHRISYLTGLLDRCIIMDAGRVVADLDRNQLLGNPAEWFSTRGLRQPREPELDSRQAARIDDADAFVRIDNAAFSYSGGELLWKIDSLALPKSGIVGVTGPNGSGKSTLIKYLLGLLRCRGSTISMAGRKLSARARRRHFAYVAQDVDYQLMGELVAAEMLIGQPITEVNRQRAQELLHMVGLEKFSHRHPLTLSGDQKQRLSIAMACMKSAEVMCLDEPTSGLDATSMSIVSNLLRSLSTTDTLIFVITHDKEFAAKTFDYRGCSVNPLRLGGYRYGEFRLALILTIVVIVVAFLGRWANNLLLQEQQVAPAVNANTAGRILEQAKLQPVMRARGLVGTGWQPVADALDQEQETLRNILRAQARPTLSFIVVAQAMFAVVLAYGLSLVLGGGLDVAAYIAIAVMAARFTGPISQLSNYAADFQNANVALESISEIVDAPGLPEPAQPRTPTSTDIQLNNIQFAYTGSKPLFQDFSLTAHAGEITAVVGPSGCGKTTITKLVARFWDVDEGSITIGGVDVRDISTEQLMDMTAIVFQDVYLFNTTIKENVRISRPDATDEEVAEAMRRAGLDSVLEYLPEGADTQVGEGGKSLSGGERQRVSIARAFLKDAPILLLDEVTSALDTENEASITASLLDLAQGRTVIIIAHRLSTVMNADQVYVLSGRESGEPTHVVESGKPTELAKQDGLFAAMFTDFKEVSRWQI